MLRVVFMGTPEFAVPALEAIHRSRSSSNDPRCEIVGVYTQPDKPVGRGLTMQHPPVKAKALELGLTVHQPEKLTLPGEFEKLSALKPDVIVVVAYGQILKRNVLDLPRLGCVNLHSSLLPRWRGAAPIQWAILGGDAETGITAMKIAEKLDAGDILLQKRTPIRGEDTAGSIHDRLATMGGEIITEALKGLSEGTIRPIPQDEALVTYASKLTKEMEWLDWHESATVLWRKVRALNPWPGTSVKLDTGERLKIKDAVLHAGLKGNEGKIYERVGMVLLGTADGALELRRMQWEGKKEVAAGEFLNGLQGRGKTLPLALQ